MKMNIDPYSMSRHAMLNRAIEEFITIRPIAVRKNSLYTEVGRRSGVTPLG